MASPERSQRQGAHLHDLVLLRRVRDRIDRDFAQPLNVEELARGAHVSAGHLSRRFNDLTDEEYTALLSVTAKGAYFGVNLAAADLEATFAALEAGAADIVQEPIDQDYGIRDCAVRDPAGNLIRIQQVRT